MLKNKAKRKGSVIFGVIAGLILMSAVAIFVIPVLGNSTYPAIESNLQEDIKNIKTVVDSYKYSNDGKTEGLTWGKLISDGVVKGAFTNSLFAADVSAVPADLFSDVYAPRYVEKANGTLGDIKIWIVPTTNLTTETSYNMIIDVSGLTDMSDKLEESLEKYVKVLVGDDNVNAGTIAAVVAPSGTTTAITSNGALGTHDGRIAFTIQ